MALTDDLKELFQGIAKMLKGHNGLASLAGRVVNPNARGAIEKRADSPVKCKPC